MEKEIATYYQYPTDYTRVIGLYNITARERLIFEQVGWKEIYPIYLHENPIYSQKEIQND